jgi:hypothetical protein
MALVRSWELHAGGLICSLESIKKKKPFLDDRRQRLFVFGQSGVYILLHQVRVDP